MRRRTATTSNFGIGSTSGKLFAGTIDATSGFYLYLPIFTILHSQRSLDMYRRHRLSGNMMKRNQALWLKKSFVSVNWYSATLYALGDPNVK
jgi:hypothetical protein